jgi:hypothetical protein
MDRDALRPEVGVLRSERRKVLLATCPVGRTPSLMGYRNDPNFIASQLIEDTVGKPAKETATPALTEDCAKFRIVQEVGGRPLKL